MALIEAGSRLFTATGIVPSRRGHLLMDLQQGIELACSLLLGSTFLVAALPKLAHHRGFTLTVLEYRILPNPIARAYAAAVPLCELFAAILLLSGTAVRSASVGLGFLLLSFLVAVGVNVTRGRKLDCHCFGQSANRQIGWGLLTKRIWRCSSWQCFWSLWGSSGSPRCPGRRSNSLAWQVSELKLPLCTLFLW